MKLFSGLFCNSVESDPPAINIGDIAHALSNLAKFGGHSDRFFSAAEHGVLVSRALIGYGPKMRLRGLLNGAPAAYLGELPQSVKAQIPLFQKAEERIRKAIMTRFNLAGNPHPGAVEDAHKRILAIELRDLLNSSDKEIRDIWGLTPPGPDEGARPVGLLPFEAHGRFLREYEEIMDALEKSEESGKRAG